MILKFIYWKTITYNAYMRYMFSCKDLGILPVITVSCVRIAFDFKLCAVKNIGFQYR